MVCVVVGVTHITGGKGVHGGCLCSKVSPSRWQHFGRQGFLGKTFLSSDPTLSLHSTLQLHVKGATTPPG